MTQVIRFDDLLNTDGPPVIRLDDMTGQRPQMPTATGALRANMPEIPREARVGGSALARGMTLGLGAAGDAFDYLDRFMAGRTLPAVRDMAARGMNAYRRATGQPEQSMPPRLNEETAAGSGPVAYPVAPPTLVPDGVPRSVMRPFGVPSSEELQAPLQQAGIVNNPDLAPRNQRERYIDRMGEVAGASIPFGARGVVSGAFSGAADELGRELGLGPWGRLGMSITGGVAGNTVYSLGERLANSVTGNLNQVGQAYREAGVTPRMAGDVSGNPALQRIQSAAGGMPGGSGRVADAADETLREFAASIDRAAANYGNARTAEQAGEALQVGARDWVGRWRTASKEAWDRVLQVIPQDRQIPIDNLRTAVNQVGQRMRDVPEVANLLNSDRFTALREAINRSPAEWRSESVRTMRTIIGQLNEAKGIVGNIFQGELDQIYAALSRDIRAAVAMRPGGLQAWETANAVTSRGHDILQNVVNNLISEGITPSTAFQFATSQLNPRTGGGARISDVANTTRAGGEVASALISQMGRRVAESRNPATFAQLSNPSSSYGLAPEAAQTLFGQPGTYERRALDALDTIARSARSTGQFANTSRTAPTSMLMNYLSGTIPAAAGAAGGMLAGQIPPSIALPALGTAAAVPAMGWMTARAMTSPAVAAYLAANSSAPSIPRAILNQAIQQALARAPALAGPR